MAKALNYNVYQRKIVDYKTAKDTRRFKMDNQEHNTVQAYGISGRDIVMPNVHVIGYQRSFMKGRVN